MHLHTFSSSIRFQHKTQAFPNEKLFSKTEKKFRIARENCHFEITTSSPVVVHRFLCSFTETAKFSTQTLTRQGPRRASWSENGWVSVGGFLSRVRGFRMRLADRPPGRRFLGPTGPRAAGGSDPRTSSPRSISGLFGLWTGHCRSAMSVRDWREWKEMTHVQNLHFSRTGDGWQSTPGGDKT